MKKILIIDDDPEAAFAAKSFLERDNRFRVEWAEDGQKGLTRALEGDFACLLLDINLPRLNGFEVLKRFRAKGGTTPIIIASVRGRENDIILGLDMGAEDYLIKPYSLRELSSRIAARLRGRKEPGATVDFVFDFNTLTATKDGVNLSLSAKEGRILKLFHENPRMIFGRDRILDFAWGVDYAGTERTVDNAIVILRKKLAPLKSTFEIKTVHGRGYQFTDKKE